MKQTMRVISTILVLILTILSLVGCNTMAATKKAKKITLNKESITINVGETATLKVIKVAPKSATKKVNWKSSNKKIATVSKKGIVTGKASGTVYITAKSKKGKASTTCKITVVSKSEMTTEKQQATTETKEDTEVTNMNVTVGGKTFTATLEKNQATKELVEMMKKKPISIKMSDYSGFEKVGSLGTSLTTSNKQTATKSGDIVLYSGNQIVVFYGSNSWSYTRLAKIDDLTGWENALGSGSVTITFSVN